MKTLVLVRHAKSSWKDASLDDHDRPLNKRGERDAPFMAKVFKEKKIHPDLIVSSTAVRAMETAKEFAKKINYEKRKILRAPELYLAELDEWIGYAKKIHDHYNTVMISGHNPGITRFANYLTIGGIDNMPTCSFCVIELDIKEWNATAAGNGTIKVFEYPKKYFPDAED